MMKKRIRTIKIRNQNLRLQIMEQLNQMMGKMALKEDVEDVKKDMGSRLHILKEEVRQVSQQTKVLIAEAVDPVKSDFNDMKKEIKTFTERIWTLENGAMDYGNYGNNTSDQNYKSALDHRVQELETQLCDKYEGREPTNTVVFGGLSNFGTFKEAEYFIPTQMWNQTGR